MIFTETMKFVMTSVLISALITLLMCCTNYINITLSNIKENNTKITSKEKGNKSDFIKLKKKTLVHHKILQRK